MTDIALDNTTDQALQTFKRFDTDTQLGLLWFGYLDLKDGLNPAPTTDVEVTAKAIFDQIQVLSPQEQLQAQRDLISDESVDISREYAALSPSAKMEVWLMLGQGMENGTIIQAPSDYQLPAETNEFTEMIKKLEFEQRVNFMRSAVQTAGALA